LTNRRIAVVDLAAWLVSAAEVVPRLGESAFNLWLAALAIVGIAAAVAWLRQWRGWRALVLGVAGVYLAYYAVRLYVLDIEPLLAIVPLPQASADAFHVMWSSPMGRLSHGEVLDAGSELWRECVMPLVQLAMVFTAARAR
jgi:hypothetical protein